MRYLLLLIFVCAFFGLALEITLEPVEPEALGSWAQVSLPLRLYPTLPRTVHYEGPELVTKLFGEIALGEAEYAILLGVSAQNEVALWVDFDGDGRLTAAEGLKGTRITGGRSWSFVLRAVPKGAEPYDYPLTVLWPEGRGYVFLVGGAPRRGFFQGHQIVLVDGDLSGVFGTKGDFLGVDVDGDGKIHANLDGHEYFALSEAFTLGEESLKVREISGDGRRIWLERTAYVPPKVPLIPGSPAPDFSFRDFLSGRELSLGNFRGKVVLLDFWATWCPPCMASLPGLKEIYEEFHAQGFEIVGVSLDESAEDLRRVLSERGISWPVAFEGKRWDNSVAALYRVYQIPTSYLLDKNGMIRYRDLEGEELRRAVAELLGESTAEAAPSEILVLPALPVKAEPILEVQVPPEAGVRRGEETPLFVRVVNTSPYLAEEVRFSVRDLPPGIEAKVPELFNIPAFGERTVRLVFSAKEVDPQVFPVSVRLSVEYHYCIAEACFQMVQEAKTALVLGAAAPGFALPWWILVLLALGVLATWFLAGRTLSIFSLALCVLALAALGFGVYLGQARQAQRIGAVLCTSCVGIEEARAPKAELSPALREAFASLPGPAHLVLFYTAWCRSCPYAKALVEEVSLANPRILVEMVDAEAQRERAEKAGVIVSGRVVVPAILVQETGKVLFGTEDLAARLLSALKEIP
ncbi:redoxin domain-containing protein [Candidatus Bipolaricaulota bacterium]|nr:redoxin domain-containing protein [Candidatus Bipolaricaulota bacterium]